ncbi:hypothetical protein HPB47_024831 [Ixodes persulcatus]|uniref:Uncharacterized protein n=1 Tax=Ixodes persulcatus TaxID=34615 RepID=A0AC60Q365_IXOPE|nr:hypothetical protein HPB47_024831 [Ixodes persulcatus]
MNGSSGPLSEPVQSLPLVAPFGSHVLTFLIGRAHSERSQRQCNGKAARQGASGAARAGLLGRAFLRLSAAEGAALASAAVPAFRARSDRVVAPDRRNGVTDPGESNGSPERIREAPTGAPVGHTHSCLAPMPLPAGPGHNHGHPTAREHCAYAQRTGGSIRSAVRSYDAYNTHGGPRPAVPGTTWSAASGRQGKEALVNTCKSTGVAPRAYNAVVEQGAIGAANDALVNQQPQRSEVAQIAGGSQPQGKEGEKGSEDRQLEAKRLLVEVLLARMKRERKVNTVDLSGKCVVGALAKAKKEL